MRCTRSCRPSSPWVSPFALIVMVAAGRTASAQVFHAQEMTATQIQGLDRAHTVVFLVGGILEQHGPYLPSYTDGYVNEYIAQQVADAIAARDGWKVLMFPPIPLGVGGANEIGGKPRFPGTYDVRETTLRAVFVDLASDLGDQGFQWIFVYHMHGAPHHSRALEEAVDYFRAAYRGHMVNLWLIAPPDMRERISAIKAAHGLDSTGEEGFSLHAGGEETSRLLSIRPDLVDAGYTQARPLTAHSFSDSMRIAQARDWPGYFGSPRLASKEFGDEWFRLVIRKHTEYALRILDGLDERSAPQWTASLGFIPGLLFGRTILWLVFGLTLAWFLWLGQAVLRFREWRHALTRQERSAALLSRQILPMSLAALAAVWVLRAGPGLVSGRFVGYPLSMLRLAPDVRQTLLLLACLTLPLVLAKLAIIAGILLKTRKVPT